MTDKKITELDSLTGAQSSSADLLPIVDVDALTTKSITRDELANAFNLDGIADMRTRTPVAGGTYYLRYHTTEGDGGHGVFRGVSGASAGTYTDDNGITIVPTGGNGSAAFVRDYDGAVSVKWFGAVGDGSTDDTDAIQAAIDATGDNGHIIFPEGNFLFATVTVDREHVTIEGNGGQLNGTIRVRHYNYLTTNDLEQFTVLRNLRFISSGNTKNAIVLNSSARGEITGCYFEGFDNAIYVPENTDNSYGQHVRRWLVSSNSYSDVNKFVLVNNSTAGGITFSLADCVITHNEGDANVDHIVIDTCDGLTVSDNIMFFVGYTEEDQIKSRCVRIIFGTWLQIHDNKFFESGKEGVYLEECSRFTLHNNVYAWAGQRSETSAIYVTGSPAAGDYFSEASINNEVIIDPSGIGIAVEAKAGRLQINNNVIERPNGVTNPRYYGTGTLASPTPALSGNKIGIQISSDTLHIVTNANLVRWGALTVPDGVSQSNCHLNNVIDPTGDGSNVQVRTKLRILSVDDTRTSIDVTNYDVVNLVQPSATNVTDIVNNGEPRNVLFRSYNTNTTFIHDATKLACAGSVNASLGTRDTITFFCESSTFVTEAARAI